MVNSISSGTVPTLKSSSINLDVTPQRKPKLDLEAVPESRVRIAPAPGGSGGQGTGLKIDIQA